MKIKLSIFLLFMICALQKGKTQTTNSWVSELSNPDADYYEILDSAALYFEANPNATERKLFTRWNAFWKDRHGDESNPGSFFPAYTAILNSFTQIDEICNDTPDNAGTWTALGPNVLPDFKVDGTLPNNGTGTSNGMGWIQKVYCDPNDASGNTVYAGAVNGGLYRTQNALATDPGDVIWEHLTANSRIPGLGVRDMLLTEDNIFLTTGTTFFSNTTYGIGLVKSSDNGATWDQTDLTITPSSFKISQSVAGNPDNPDIIYVAVRTELHKSLDGGESFNLIFDAISNGPGPDFDGRRKFQDIVLKPGDPNTIYLSSLDIGGDDFGARFYRATDGGIDDNSFTDLTSTVFNTVPTDQKFERIDIGVTEIEPNWVYLSLVTVDANEIRRSYIVKTENDGLDWVIKGPFSNVGTPGKNDLEVSPNNPDRLYVGGLEIMRSTNGGNSFTSMNERTYHLTEWVHDDIRDVEIINNNGSDVIYVGFDGGVARSTNDGATWVNIFGQGLNVSQFYGIDVSTDGSIIAGGCLDQGLVRYRDGVWLNPKRVGDAGKAEIDPYNKEVIYAQSWAPNPTLRKSINGGDEWPGTNTPGLNKALFPMETYDNQQIYVGTTNVFKRDINGSTTWEQIGVLDIDEINTIAVAPSNYDVIYAARETWCGNNGNNILFKTEDAELGITATWTDITNCGADNCPLDCKPLKYGVITDIEVHPEDSETLWVSINRFVNGKRVLLSTDGGTSWQDVSTGLPKFPMTTLAYDENTGALYVGTDVGVFVNTDPTNINSSWQCFNKDFPTAIVSDLEVNYCQGKIYASTYGNGVWAADLLDIPNVARKINQDQTWAAGTKRLINSDLSIEAGVTLTIEGEVYIAEGRKIIVQPNGNLVINGGYLSTLCDNMWQGIVVIGNKDKSQYTDSNGDRYQGRVVLVDGIIEHAIEGISLYDIDDPNKTTGGIVIGNRAKFINCQRAVNFQPYINTYPLTGAPIGNFGNFQDSEFIINSAFKAGPIDHRSQILVEGVDGIRFKGCDFRNETYWHYASRGIGLEAMDAHFQMLGRCTDTSIPCNQHDRSTISGFATGINVAMSGCNPQVYEVDRTDFSNNYFGLINNAVNNAKITRSVFDIGGQSYDTQGNDGGGIMINTGTGFIIESNTFNGQGSTSNALGVLVKEAGESFNQVYLNEFNGLNYGNLSNGVNRNPISADDGLKYFCNKNELNTFDFAVPNESSNLNGISQNQGSPVEAAGNTFSFLPVDNNGDFFNESTSQISYHYNDDDIEEIPSNDISPLVVPVYTINSAICTNHYPDDPQLPGEPNPGDTGINGFTLKYNVHKPDYDNLTSLKNSLIDGGNTTTLINNITGFQNGGAQLKVDLLNLSPYLSRGALMAAANRDDILSHTDIYDIMIANPDESRAAVLLTYLETKANPLPLAMITTLGNQPYPSTARTTLESDLSYHGAKVNAAIHFFLNHYANDTLNMDSIQYWLDIQGGLMNDYAKVDLYIKDQNLIAAGELLSQIPQVHDLSVSQTAEYTYFQLLKTLEMNMLSQSLTCKDFDAGQVQQLVNIAEQSKSIAGQQARNILNHAYGYDYQPSIIFPQSSSGNGKRLTNSSALESSTNKIVIAFPNPATDLVTFEYTLEGLKTGSKISIFDLKGNLIESIPLSNKSGFVDWYTKEVESGLYIYSIGYAEHVLESGQISVVK